MEKMQKLTWDYTALADAYVHRPGYSDAVIDRIIEIAGLPAQTPAVDLGAGTGHLTIKLAQRGFAVTALEPNARMRAHGIRRTQTFHNVRWVDGMMEDSRLPSGHFRLAGFGSSFGLAEHTATLRETARILQPDGWFVCLWNHRDLTDPLQKAIEAYIRECIPNYAYGSRREDQTAAISESGLFSDVYKIEKPIVHVQPVSNWVAAWRSHATLQRQAGERFQAIVDGITRIVLQYCADTVRVPYVTRAWLARRLF